jgi:hypothetical protein
MEYKLLPTKNNPRKERLNRPNRLMLRFTQTILRQEKSSKKTNLDKASKHF